MDGLFVKVLKGSDYSLSQFSSEHIALFEKCIYTKQDKNGKDIYYV